MSWNGNDRTDHGAWTRQETKETTPRCLAKGLRWGVALIATLAAGGLAIWFWRSVSAHSATDNAHGPEWIADVGKTNARNVAVATVQQKEKDPHAGYVLSSTGVWQPADRPYRAGSKKVHSVVTNSLRRSVARSGTDQVLLGIFSRSLGDMPLPLPARLPERDLKRMTEILIEQPMDKADDSEMEKFDKETLRLAKQEARKFIKDGGTIEEFIRHYHDELTRAYHERTDAQRYMVKIYRDGEDAEVVTKMVETINKKLESRGIKKIRNPVSLGKKEK